MFHFKPFAMKPLFILIFFLLSFTMKESNGLDQEGKLQVLIVTGGHRFDREAFFAMFDSFGNMEYTELSHPGALDYFGAKEIRTFDAVVFYDMPNPENMTSGQKNDIKRFFEKGAPAVFLHHALVSYPYWDEFSEIVGGRFYDKNPLIAHGDTIRSGYRHDVTYTVKVANPNHPVTLGMSDFEIEDEVYNRYYVKEDVEPLLTTDHPESDKLIGWINRYGRSQIVYLLNGHDVKAYSNENYRRLLKNAIEWVSEEAK